MRHNSAAMHDIGTIGNTAFPRSGALMGLDLGTKTIGLAISNPEQIIALPVTTIRRTKFTKDVDTLLTLAQARHIVGFILGLPLNMDGSEGPRAQSTRAFARNLAKRTSLPIDFWDERLSSATMERMLIEIDMRRARRKDVIDEMAASYILQGALDALIQQRQSDL